MECLGRWRSSTIRSNVSFWFKSLGKRKLDPSPQLCLQLLQDPWALPWVTWEISHCFQGRQRMGYSGSQDKDPTAHLCSVRLSLARQEGRYPLCRHPVICAMQPPALLHTPQQPSSDHADPFGTTRWDHCQNISEKQRTDSTFLRSNQCIQTGKQPKYLLGWYAICLSFICCFSWVPILGSC